MPENQPQPYKEPEFIGAGWGSDLMRKWKSLGQNIGVQNIALARLLNKLSEDMGFSPPPSDKIKTRGGPGAMVEAISGPVANPKSIAGAIRVLKQFSPDFAQKVKSPLIHNTSLEALFKIVKSGGLKGLTSDIKPAPGKLKELGSVSLTRSMETSIPAGEPKNVKLIYDKEDIRKIGQLKPFSWQPRLHRLGSGKSAKMADINEAEEVFKQAGKKIPIIPNDILRGLVIRGGSQFPSDKAFGHLSQLNVPTVLTPRATQMMLLKDHSFKPSSLSRSRTKNIVPTYETGSQGSYVGDLSTDFRGTGIKNTEFLMKLIEWLGRQGM